MQSWSESYKENNLLDDEIYNTVVSAQNLN